MAWDKSNKCSCCGYKFKKGDGSICPECLTSREETMSCNDLTSDLHSHKKGFVNEKWKRSVLKVKKALERKIKGKKKDKRYILRKRCRGIASAVEQGARA